MFALATESERADIGRMLPIREVPFPLIQSVVSGRQAGLIYCNRENNESVFILHTSGFGYVHMAPGFKAAAFIGFIKTQPEVPPYFHLYDASDALHDAVVSTAEINYKIRTRKQLRMPAGIRQQKMDVPEGAQAIEVIGKNNFTVVDELGCDIGSRFWTSRSDFIAEGLGVFVVVDGKAVAVCYSACIENGIAEIDVFTLPEYRKRGYAQYAVNQFCQEAVKRSIVPNWDCFEENAASLHTALQAGFSERFAYPFLSIYDPAKNA